MKFISKRVAMAYASADKSPLRCACAAALAMLISGTVPARGDELLDKDVHLDIAPARWQGC